MDRGGQEFSTGAGALLRVGITLCNLMLHHLSTAYCVPCLAKAKPVLLLRSILLNRLIMVRGIKSGKGKI